MTENVNPGSNVSIALLHHPVYDKNRQVVTTSVTNLDLHDIARAAKTYGLFRYYVVNPVAEQRALAERIARHWQVGWGATYNPKRREALDLMRVVAGLDDALEDLRASYGKPARILVTGAQRQLNSISCAEMTELIRDRSYPCLLLFGTGWGLTEEFFAKADYVLESIKGPGDYNHLSVRSAAAIILDRLLGQR